MKTPISEAYTLDDFHHVIDDEASCGICGDQFDVGQQAIEVPFDPIGNPKLLVTVHLGCAVNGNEVEL